MLFFKRYFSGVLFDKEQTRVACPFHKDDNPSASINTTDSLFHCPVCQEGYNEVGFVAKLNNISLVEAAKVISKLEDAQTNNWGIIEKAELWGDVDFLREVKKLISEETIEKLNLGLVTFKGQKFLGIPIFYNGVIMDVRKYNILKEKNFPKVMGDSGAQTGHIFPYDIWVKDERETYIMEGEKDALVARDFGLNAITLTGGAGAVPNNLVLQSFKNKDIILCYDNDDAGRKGMDGIFKALYKIAKSIKFINIAEVVINDKEDFSDAVFKYNLDEFTFDIMVRHEFNLDLLKEDKRYSTLKDALGNNRIKKALRSVVAVSAEFSDMFALPVIVEASKVAVGYRDSQNSISVGTTFNWFFDMDKKVHQLLELVEFNARTEDIESKIKSFMGIPKNEAGISVKVKQSETVYKYKVADANTRLVVNDDEDGINNTLMDMYSFDKLEVGVEYEVEYILLPHPFKNQKITAVATKINELNIGKDFKIDIDKLKTFQTKGTIDQRVNYLYQSAKHHIAKHLNYHMWLMSDLVFNSVLEIDYGVRTWGALDVFILGDTATGKSEATKGMVNLYDFGHFLSLKTATPVGLIGGSKKEGESLVNTIGAVPRQHKKLVVMEEFSGAPPAFIKSMTDIRTTRRVHIIRVSGELSAPCNLRMITISNPLGDEKGLPKYLSTFPNGVLPLMELINNPEDVGRYDGFLLVPQVTSRFNPFLLKLEGEPIPKENYEHKSRWVYTRQAENIKYDDGVEAYIWEKAEELNKKYDSNFPLFGTKASLKLARFSIALASLIVNVDDKYENIVVTKNVVDFIVNFFDEIYDNAIFKLKDYKIEYDSYSNVTKEDIEVLQELYPKNSNIIEYLDGTSTTSLDSLRANSGLDTKDFNILYTKLSQYKFIRSLGRSIVPTTKLRKALRRIDKNFTSGAGLSKAKSKTYVIEEEFDGV